MSFVQIITDTIRTNAPVQTQMSVWTMCDVVQSVSGNMNGLLPTGLLSTTNNQLIFAPDVNQGLVDPVSMGINQPLRLLRVVLFMAGQSTWAINLLDGTSTFILASGTVEANYTHEKLTYVSGAQKLQVITTGGGTSSVKLIATLASVNSSTFGA